MAVRADVRREDGRVDSVVVEDISTDGCRVTGEFEIGERLGLEIPSLGHIEGQVRWSFWGKAGMRFDRPLAWDNA